MNQTGSNTGKSAKDALKAATTKGTPAVPAEGSVAVAGGAPVIGAPAQPVARPANTLQLTSIENIETNGRGRKQFPFWWRNRMGDLAVVTDQASNPALGILDIQISPPSDAQRAIGIIAKVSMQSMTGWDYGIAVRESNNNPGDVWMSGNRRKVEREGKDTEYVNDRTFSDAAQAQILSYVYRHLIPAQPVAPIQPAQQ